MTRIIRPVGIFSLVIAVISFVINDTLVPNAQKQALSITAQVSDSLAKKASQPIYRPILENNRVVATVSALDFNLADRTLSRATIVSYDEQLNPVATLHAARLKFENPKDWRIDGTAVLLSTDGGTRTELTGGAWPQAIPNPADSPEEMSAQSVNDPDYFTTGELREQLSRSKIDKSLTPEMVRNREYWLWNKFAVPAAAFVFGILGAGLGIRSHRAGTATGFALAIGILFAYMFLANFLNVWAMGGIMPPYVASFTPIILAFVAAVLIIWRRNRG
jgi:lipopolysaccharide export system permease protein